MANKLLLLLSFLFLTSLLISKTSEATSKYGNPCGACKHLRRHCQPDCILRPYFPRDQPKKFENIRRFFGAYKIMAILHATSEEQREYVVETIQFEAHRLYIQSLENRLAPLQDELLRAKNEFCFFKSTANSNPSATVSSDPASAESFDHAAMASFSPVSTAAATTLNLGFTAAVASFNPDFTAAFNPIAAGESSSSGFGAYSSNRTNLRLGVLHDGIGCETEETMPSLELTDIQQPLHITNDPSLRSLTETANANNGDNNNENATVDLLVTLERTHIKRNDDGNPFP